MGLAVAGIAAVQVASVWTRRARQRATAAWLVASGDTAGWIGACECESSPSGGGESVEGSFCHGVTEADLSINRTLEPVSSSWPENSMGTSARFLSAAA